MPTLPDSPRLSSQQITELRKIVKDLIDTALVRSPITASELEVATKEYNSARAIYNFHIWLRDNS